MQVKQISKTYGQIFNLVQEIKFHKRMMREGHCNSECNVSMSTLIETAERLVKFAYTTEQAELQAMIEETRIR